MLAVTYAATSHSLASRSRPFPARSHLEVESVGTVIIRPGNLAARLPEREGEPAK